MEIDKKYFWWSFGSGLLLYVASFLGWSNPILNYLLFAGAGGLIIYLLAQDFSWAIPLLIFESILGSQGRLLFLNLDGFVFSLRYLLFILVIIFFIIHFIKNPTIIYNLSSLRSHFGGVGKFKIYNLQNSFWLLGLIFIGWGILNATLAGTPLKDIFFDANAYGFWLLWPIFYLYYNSKNYQQKTSGSIFTIAIAAIFVQTFATYLLFITQIVSEIQPFFYVWARDVRLAEMTKIGEYGVRIFWQSHIWAVMSLGLIGILLWLKKINYYYWAALFLGLAMLSTILSFSRSFLLALGVSLIITLILSRFIFVPKHEWKQLTKTFSASLAVCLLLLIGTMYLARQHFITLDDLGESRWSNLTSEQASASRVEELKPLWQQILAAPILGSGFGYKLTYQSFDPRQNQKPYTTFSFEWGYLDMWLKMGLGFLLALFGFVYATFKKYRQMYYEAILPDYGFLLLTFALTFLLLTHLTTPYLNHPLGLIILFWLASYRPSYSNE